MTRASTGTADGVGSIAVASAQTGKRTRRSRKAPRNIVIAIVVLALALVAVFAFRKVFGTGIDKGFVEFEPDVSLFPAAPDGDAQTFVGIGAPDAWREERLGCSYPIYQLRYMESAVRRDWRTVRHDWDDEDAAKSWIVSERTVEFTDLDEYDDYVVGLSNMVRQCGADYAGDIFGAKYNAVYTEVQGLPGNGFAFTIGADPTNGGARSFRESDPAEFQGMGAVLPGRERGQVMLMTWIGWGADVPADQFVATANTLYDAAHDAPEPPDEAEDDGTIEFDFTPFDMERAGVRSIIGDARETTDGWLADDWLSLDLCSRDAPTDELIQVDESEFAPERQSLTSDFRNVVFAADRWRSRAGYFAAKRRLDAYLGTPCISSLQHAPLLIEPVTLPGLPGGTIVSRWHDWSESYAALVSDDERQTMMVVAWSDDPGPVPADDFVEVVNRAWDQFQSDNP